MNIYCNLDQNGNFLNATQEDIYNKYDIKKEQIYTSEELEEKGLIITCKENLGKNKYAYLLDKTGCIFPMYQTIVNGVESYKQIAARKTRESRKEKIDNYIQILQRGEELQSIYVPMVTKEEIQNYLTDNKENTNNENINNDNINNDNNTIEVTEEQVNNNSTVQIEQPILSTNQDVNDINVILSIKSKKERCNAFKKVSLSGKKIMIKQLLNEGKLKDILVLLTSKESEKAIKEFDPFFIKMLYETMIHMSENEIEKNKSTILKYIRVLTDNYPQITGLFRLLGNDQKKQFYDLVSPKILKKIYKENPSERATIEEYLHNERIKLQLEIYKNEQLVALHEDGKESISQKDKQEEFTDEEYQLFNLKKPSQLETYFEKRRQKFIDKYHLEPINNDGTNKIVLYDIDKVADKVPAIDRFAFKTAQQLYLNNYNGRIGKNKNKILSQIKLSEASLKHNNKLMQLEEKDFKAKQQKILGLIKFSNEEKKIKQIIEEAVPNINYETDNQLINYIKNIVNELKNGTFQEPELIEQVASLPKKSIATITKEKMLVLKETIKEHFNKKHEMDFAREEEVISKAM